MRAVSEIEERQAKRRKGPAPSRRPAAAGGPRRARPETGEVRAMVGAEASNHSRFNRATQARRQAGSALQPLCLRGGAGARLYAASMISAVAAR